MPAILYHYTTATALAAILREQSLRPSLLENKPSDVRYGDGQYLTDVPPGVLTDVELSRLLVLNFRQGHRFTHYLAIDVTNLPVIRGRNAIYVVPSRENLSLEGRIIHAGPNL